MVNHAGKNDEEQENLNITELLDSGLIFTRYTLQFIRLLFIVTKSLQRAKTSTSANLDAVIFPIGSGDSINVDDNSNNSPTRIIEMQEYQE